MYRRWSSLLRSRKGAQTFEYVAIIAAALLIALALYSFLTGGEVKQTINTKIEQILAGESGSITAPDDENQSTLKPLNMTKKTLVIKKPSLFEEATNFVLDSIPIIGNIKAGYEVISGKDIFGNELSTVDRTISGAGILIPWVKHGKRAINVVDEGIDIVRGAGRGKPTRTGCACQTGKNKTPDNDKKSDRDKTPNNDKTPNKVDVGDHSKLGTGKVGDFSNIKGASVDDIISRIPKHAEKRVLHPVEGGAQRGFEYKWKEDGKTWRVRVHDPDPSAPAGSNASENWTVRVQRGREFMDENGVFHKQNKMNPRSPHYDEKVANDTHIPIKTPQE